MKLTRAFWLGALWITSVSAFAQGNSNNTPAANGQGTLNNPVFPGGPLGGGSAADNDWQALSIKAGPITLAPILAIDKAPDQKKSAVQQNVESLRDAAKTAQDFYTKYPNDPRAASARKLELTSNLQAQQLSPDPLRVLTLAKSDAFRKDTTNSAKDRFDVELAQQTALLTSALRGQRLIDNGAVAEGLADKLYADLGGTPEVGGQYLNILHTADHATAVRVATKLKGLNVSASVKQAAQRTLDLDGRLNQPITELALATTDGGKVDFSTIRKPTAVFFWNSLNGTGDLALLNRFKASVPAGVQWIYVGLGKTYPSAVSVKTAAPFAGQFCSDISGLSSPVANYLGARQAPYVAVIDRKGTLAGFGRVEDLLALLAVANR